MPTVTIIVPVYNVEKYLSACIDSILSQTFCDFELILINDGSKDNSGEICENYAKTESRIIVIHQKNTGVSEARNKGISEAIGEFVCFIDSDDWVDKELLSEMLDNSHLYDLTVQTSVSYDYSKKSVVKKIPYSKTTYKSGEIDQFLIENDFFNIGDGGCCSKLFKRNIINFDNQRFYLHNAAYEDTLFTFEYLCKCNSVHIVQGAHYHYIHREENSLSTTIHPYNNYFDSGLNGLKTLTTLRGKYNILAKSPFYIKGITKFLNILNYSVFSLYSNSKKIPQVERINLLKSLIQVNEQNKQYYFPKNVKQKIVSWILKFDKLKSVDKLFIILFKIAAKLK